MISCGSKNTSAGAADVTAPALVVEGGSITALNSTVDLGLSVSVGTTLPRWVPVLGEHLAFVDALTVGGEEAIGASVSLQRWQTDDGLRIGATLSVIGAVVGELVGSNRGLGFLVNIGRGQYDTALVFVAVFTLVTLALALYLLVTLVERRLLSWQTAPSKQNGISVNNKRG